MRLLIKRDDTSLSYPHPDQLEVGELVMNSVTGKLYSKLVDGSIVQWFSEKVCFDPVPDLLFYYGSTPVIDSLDTFCCAGDLLIAEITNLKPEPKNYTFTFTELTSNTSPTNIVISPTQYSIYNQTQNDSTITLRKAIVPINLSIDQSNNISIFKFTVLSDNLKLIEKLISIKCYEQACASS
jgi:hypothetical protein